MPPTAASSTIPPPIIFPPVPSIAHILCGLDDSVADRLSRIYALQAVDLQLAIQKSADRACRDFANLPHHSAPLPDLFARVQVMHAAMYTRGLEKLQKAATTVISERRPPKELLRRRSSEKKHFNHEFAPFLQKYFDYNAFPSAADRVAMAKKSLMEPRQIEVWFQNHRARAKKEGKTMRRLGPADPAPLDLCLRSFEEKMDPYLIPEPLRQCIDSDVSEAGSEDEEDEDEFDDEKHQDVVASNDSPLLLSPPAARHAFPIPWSRCKHMVSAILPTLAFSFPAPDWRRKPTSTIPERPAVAIEDCITAFANMHVYDSRRIHSEEGPFRIATIVIPSPAPLPSLVRGKFTPSPVVPTTALNIVPAPRSRLHPFRSPSPSAQLITLVSASPRRKKVAGPPRRTPKRAPNTNFRGASPATSDTSTTRSASDASTARSMSPPSRTPSLESNGFSPSRTPSFSSNGGFSSRSSSGSSGPATPTGSPAPLPLFETFDDYARLQEFAHGTADSPVEDYTYVDPAQLTRKPRARQQYAFEAYADARR